MKMTKAELKQNITKITQILQSESYDAGFELLKTLDEPELTSGLSEVINTTLREKYFKENALEEGLEIAGILQLTELDLSSLGLTTLRFKSKPNPLNNLIHLKKLNLRDNKLKSLQSILRFYCYGGRKSLS